MINEFTQSDISFVETFLHVLSWDDINLYVGEILAWLGSPKIINSKGVKTKSVDLHLQLTKFALF